MNVCTVVGIGGSIVTRSREIAKGLSESLEAGGNRVVILEASSYARNSGNPAAAGLADPIGSTSPAASAAASSGSGKFYAALEDPASYDSAAFFRAAVSEKDSGRTDILVLVLGPLCSVPEIAALCTLKVFFDIEERLMLLRWADALMREGSPGGIEALSMYSAAVEPVYRSWSPAAMASSTLVLDEEEGYALLIEKILWLIEKTGMAPGPAPAASTGVIAKADRPGNAERLAIIKAMESRYSQPATSTRGAGQAFRMFMADTVYPAAKRALDVTLVSLLLMVIWPVFVLVAFLIWLDDPGPVFYSQTRIGKFGKTFPFPKFRSMVRDADKLKDKLLAQNEMTGGITFKMKRDPRIIPIGFVIRKYSLDELPQLWSILKGDLSLVGPRPPVPREVALYTAADRRRLEAVPGLTCIWQVSGRSEIPFPKQVELDVDYLESRSLSLDLRLLLATIPAVLTGRGAY